MASLAIRDQLDRLEPDEVHKAIAHAQAAGGAALGAAFTAVAAGGRTGQFGSLTLNSKIVPPVPIRLDALGAELYADHRQSLDVFVRLAGGGLLTYAWELLGRRRNSGEVMEFLYHCRDAAAHDGRFTFTKHEPRYHAAWRGLVVDRAIEGHLLFHDGANPGFIGTGDPVHLLADIDCTQPNSEQV
jgi:hypothetical protein